MTRNRTSLVMPSNIAVTHSLGPNSSVPLAAPFIKPTYFTYNEAHGVVPLPAYYSAPHVNVSAPHGFTNISPPYLS